MLILDQKGANLDQKGPKRVGADFFQPVNLNFLKEDHYTSFYTKNQQNSIKSLEDISSNVDFGPKRGQIWTKKRPKRAGPEFFSTQDWCQITKGNYL